MLKEKGNKSRWRELSDHKVSLKRAREKCRLTRKSLRWKTFGTRQMKRSGEKMTHLRTTKWAGMVHL